MRKPLKCWTDYPFLPEDAKGGEAPIREVYLVEYDGNKLAKIKFKNNYYVFKSGYLYCAPVDCDTAFDQGLHVSQGTYQFKFNIDDWYDSDKDDLEFYNGAKCV